VVTVDLTKAVISQVDIHEGEKGILDLKFPSETKFGDFIIPRSRSWRINFMW